MTDLHTENARLRAALEWYADSDNYETQYEKLPCECCTDIFEPINRDRGERARAVLATPAPDAVQEAARTRLLEKALKVAMGHLAPHQPDDSSAVDDWFLACAAVQAELDDADGRIEACLDAALLTQEGR